LDVELHPDQGGEIVQLTQKPHQGVQAAVLPAGVYRREASRPDLPRTQPLRERTAALEERVRGPWRASLAFTERQPSGDEALEAKIAELERFCGQLSLENQILKKSLKSSR
jgi:hypothetical protein